MNPKDCDTHDHAHAHTHTHTHRAPHIACTHIHRARTQRADIPEPRAPVAAPAAAAPVHAANDERFH